MKALKLIGRILMVALILVGLGITFSTFTKTELRKPEILLIAKSGTSNFWKTTFQGANAAASEYNVNLTIKAPLTEEDYAAQNQMLQWGIDHHMSAIVFSACDYNKSVEMVEKVIAAGIPLISIDSPVNSQKNITLIATDNTQAGWQAGEAIGALTGYEAKIGIINFEEGSANGMQREKGFLEAVAQYPGMEVLDIRYTLSNLEDPKQNTIEMLEQYAEINAIATFNEWTTLGVGAALEELQVQNEKMAVIGFDNNIASIDQLERGVFDGLVVQNPFAMGYIGVEQALGYPKKKEHQPFIDTGTTVITTENMYNIENQKLLFPFSD